MTLQRQEAKKHDIDLILFEIPQNVLLQISTGTALLAILSARACAEVIQVVSQASEEVLRGDRLPVLPFPEASKSDIT